MPAVVWISALVVYLVSFAHSASAQDAPEPAPAPEAGPPAAPPPPADDSQASAPPAGEERVADEAESPEQAVAAGDEIVVTAQKRQDKLVEVPISISVVTPEDFKASGAKNLTELQGVKPGVYFSGNTGYGGAPMAIRGTAGTNTALLDDPVALYIDGVYIPSGAFAATTLIDLAGIEVARGPQGTLQGRNATAGAVILRNADPKFTFGGYGRATLAAPFEYRLEAAATAPVVDSLAARVSLGYANQQGWADNTFNGKKLGSTESLIGRLVLLFSPSDPVHVRLATSYSSVKAEPAIARWAKTNINPDTTMPLIGAPPSPYQGTPTEPLDPADRSRIEDGKFALNRPNDATMLTFFNALEAGYSFEDFAELISVTGLILTDTKGNSDSDGLAVTGREGFNKGTFDTQTVSEELRLQSNTKGFLSWILGGYYSFAHQKMDFRIYNLNLTPLPPGLPATATNRYTVYDADQDDTSYAAFADATAHLRKWLALTGGVRYTYEKKAFTFNTYARTVPDDVDLMVPSMSPKSPKGWDDVSYRGKLSFTPIDPLLLYASFSTGFKSGGYNAFGPDAAFNPERLWSGELGAKMDLPERRGYMAAAGYYNRYNGLQIRSGVPTGGVAVRNAADSEIKGFEAEAHVRVGYGFSVDANVAYADAKFKSFPLAVNIVGMMVDATGNHLPRTPKVQYFGLAAYDLPVGDTWTLRGEVSYRFRDRVYYYHTDQASPALQGDPLGELGARISAFYDPIDLRVSVFGTNLTDARSVNGFSPNFGYPVISLNMPRVIGIEAEKKF